MVPDAQTVIRKNLKNVHDNRKRFNSFYFLFSHKPITATNKTKQARERTCVSFIVYHISFFEVTRGCGQCRFLPAAASINKMNKAEHPLICVTLAVACRRRATPGLVENNM